jgi:ketosteroid isomerase-like protein
VVDEEQLARRLIAAVERGDATEVRDMPADDVEQVELPNRLMPTGATRDTSRSSAPASGARRRCPLSGSRS